MGQAVIIRSIENVPNENELTERIEWTIKRCRESERPFFILILQLENFEAFSRRYPRYVCLNLLRDLFQAFRRAVPTNLFIGHYKNGFGFIFDLLEGGMVDRLARALSSLATKVARDGHYNQMASRWTEIIRQFLFPQAPLFLIPRIGWAIFPRDGQDSDHLLKRALYHLKEFNR